MVGIQLVIVIAFVIVEVVGTVGTVVDVEGFELEIESINESHDTVQNINGEEKHNGDLLSKSSSHSKLAHCKGIIQEEIETKKSHSQIHTQFPIPKHGSSRDQHSPK